MSVPANPQFIDCIDTFYNYVATNLDALTIASSVKVTLQGVANAQDWPQNEIVDGGLYLLYLSSVPVEEEGTRAQTYFEHYMQWAWVFLGNDLTSKQVGANRGSRHRDDLAVVEALRQAHFPGFCPKQFSTVDPTTGAVTFTPYSPEEMIHWAMPRLGTKLAASQSGVLYGTAALEVYGWSTVSPLVNA
jgi:hypothetical protein